MHALHAWLPAALERGVTILTPDLRTARLLTRHADAETAKRGAVSWQAASILPLSASAALLWQDAVIDGAETRIVLNEIQERALWTTVIQKRPGDTLRPARFQADLCMRANRLLGSYDVEELFQGLSTRASGTADHALFRRFHEDFRDVCSHEGYLPASHLEQELTSLLLEGRLQPGKEYLLHGFTDHSPARQAFWKALRQAGATVEETSSMDRRCAPPIVVQCATPQAEWQHCAHWVREHLQSKTVSSIVIVAPDLADIRSDLERELRLAVAPELADVTCPAVPPYEFSNGRPLRTLPLVRDALNLLRWCAGDLTLDEAGSLLRSRHLGLVDSPEMGAILDERAFRKRPGLRNALSLRQCASTLQALGASHRLHDLERTAHRYRSAKDTHAHFTDGARTLLQLAGWPGTDASDSAEFQARERWERLLDEVATLDLLGSSTRFQDVLETIITMAERTLFAPENRGEPVQVMSFTEAQGSTADVMWFLSSDSTTWPSRPAPDPLLPLSLQRELRMPGTDEGLDEERAARALAHMTEAMGSTCFSYSGDLEGEPAHLSTLIEQRVVNLHGAHEVATLEEIATLRTPALELVRDTVALPPLPTGPTAGGVGVLTAQSQCGFRAWAEKRLFTQPSEAVEDGLSPRDRGDQVHLVLQMFWDKARDQATLKRLRHTVTENGGSARNELVAFCIAEVCRPASGEWDEAYLHVQRERLFRLVAAWLDVEETRPPFRVLELERSLENVTVGPLRLKMRVDRVDEIAVPPESEDEEETTGTVLIDYKTGPASRNDWLGERPAQPQLPAYAVTAARAAGLAQVDGIAFALVRAGEDHMKVEGLAELGLLAKNQRKSSGPAFADQCVLWTEEVESLASAFAAGDAAVAPRRYPQTCEHCSQRILCRVNTATLWQEDEEAAEAEGALW